MSERFGPYELEEKLGTGAMGDVWRAIDTRLVRPVAVKRLLPGCLDDPAARGRFLRESRAASALNHPNIVTVFEAGEQDGEPYIVMELIEGRTLRDVLATGNFNRELALDVARQMLSGLAAAHAVGIVHRDIKPENLMVRHDGYVKILDFGLATVLEGDMMQTQSFVGTPMYMSPEQATGQPLDARTDVFSAAAVIYEMLGGKPPHHGESLHEIIAHMLEHAPGPLAQVSADLNDLLLRALEKEPAKRFVDAGAMLAAIRRATHERDRPEPRGDVTNLIVLPLDCNEADVEVADGVTDEVISNLEQIGGLNVIARSTSMRYRGMDARQVARELNVEMLLEGSLRRSGNRVRVTAGLVDARTGCALWSGRFESRLADVFDLQDELANAIIVALRERFQSLAALRKGGVDALKTEANELYTRAIRKLDKLTVENILSACEGLAAAIKLQPDFAPAHARLAQALAHKINFLRPAEAAPLMAQAMAAANEAIRLDPGSPDAHFALGYLQIANPPRDWRAARRQLRHALRLSPNHVPSLSWLGYVQILMGYPEDGERLARQALSRDPQGANHLLWLASACMSQGRYEDAADAAERGLRLDGDNPLMQAVLLILDLWRGRDTSRFAQSIEATSMHYPVVRAAWLVNRAVTAGLRWEDVSELDRLSFGHHYLTLRAAALIPALQGDVETAVSLLEQAHAMGYRNVPMLDADPLLEKIRKAERYVAFRSRLLKEIAEDPEQ